MHGYGPTNLGDHWRLILVRDRREYIHTTKDKGNKRMEFRIYSLEATDRGW